MCCGNISMNVSVISNVVIVQCRGCCGNITMDVFAIVNVVMVQLIADYEKKTQHRWRCSPQTIR